ncbi:hypothetical protein TSTA_080030 [Talaromyces stipitatus ATCC 10500]|uniref:Uncharacterized protein n=1 Tax=Talaromyces stipitatus (strain ATCC 10500 / CBS 375.48 / QM 6759 / NRRL 1006) TaxID=441959 RepID=B8LXR3_TALSN|nr:uncharacterized protein TSTA_080030 [Talaromyces stipitatus ATCC 10500]EED24648.1 hypothetical protein TSTA_080030 [Talaromyces stipitatus ATCC 10500]
MSITSGSLHRLSDENEERRLRALMAQNPPQIPYHGVYVRQADGQAGQPAEPMRHWDPRGLIDPIYEGKRRQQAVAKKVKTIQAKVQKELNSISDQRPALVDQIQELKGELEKDFNDLDRLIVSLTVHWVHIEDEIAREYGYRQANDDQLKILGLAYTDAKEKWYRTHSER